MEWRNIPEFDGYMVSERGDIMSCARDVPSKRYKSGTKAMRAKLMCPYRSRDGYFTIDLVRNGQRHKVRVHHAVASAFIGPWPKGAECVRHLDDVRTNNDWHNLAYGTIRENVADSIRFGTFTRGEKNGQAKLTNAQVSKIKREIAAGARTGILAARYRISAPTISDIKAGRKWAHIAAGA